MSRSRESQVVIKRSKKNPWKDMKRSAELDCLIVYVQGLLDVPYLNHSHRHRFKFQPEGQDVVILAQGLYYHATTMSYYRLCNPESIFKEGKVMPVEDRVVSYRLSKKGWPDPIRNQEELSENEIIPTEMDDPVAVIGMLSAHLWNVWRQKEYGYKDTERAKMGAGVWFLDSEEYGDLEKLWQVNSHETSSFEQFCTNLHTASLQKPVDLPDNPAASY